MNQRMSIAKLRQCPARSTMFFWPKSPKVVFVENDFDINMSPYCVHDSKTNHSVPTFFLGWLVPMAEGFTNPILLVRSPCWLKWPLIVVSKAHVVHWIIELSMRSQSFVGFFDTFMALSSYPAQSDCLPSVWTNFCLKSPSQLMTSRAGRRCFWEIRKWTNKFSTSFPSSFHGPKTCSK